MKNTIPLFIFILFFISCKKVNVAEGTPACIKSEVKKFSESKWTCPHAHVDEMQFQSNTVYVFDEGCSCCDVSTSVYDKNAKHIGTLGGFDGNTKINGQEFSSAIFIRTIWKK